MLHGSTENDINVMACSTFQYDRNKRGLTIVEQVLPARMCQLSEYHPLKSRLRLTILQSLDSKPPPESKPPSKVSPLYIMYF